MNAGAQAHRRASTMRRSATSADVSRGLYATDHIGQLSAFLRGAVSADARGKGAGAQQHEAAIQDREAADRRTAGVAGDQFQPAAFERFDQRRAARRNDVGESGSDDARAVLGQCRRVGGELRILIRWNQRLELFLKGLKRLQDLCCPLHHSNMSGNASKPGLRLVHCGVLHVPKQPG